MSRESVVCGARVTLERRGGRLPLALSVICDSAHAQKESCLTNRLFFGKNRTNRYTRANSC